MLQLFLKTSQITADQWHNAYQRIRAIVQGFPIRLIRIEAYNSYSPNIDKDHFTLETELNTPDEHIAFRGDWMSFSAGNTIRFYKDWEKHKASLSNDEQNANKPIIWYPYKPFKNDGTLPDANGAATPHGYIDTHGALYEYAIIAIGIMLEKLFDDNAVVLIHEQDEHTIQQITEWLSVHFKEDFDLPICCNKERLLETLSQHCDSKLEIVCRFEHLFRKQYKRNMSFALDRIGYEPTIAFYAEVLSDNYFATFGFVDVLDAWIGASQNLESTLELIAKSKALLEKNNDAKKDKYDLGYILKKLLNNYILWTPLQREELAIFYTNKESLETGRDDLMGSLIRMSGYRLDICPMYATEDELFEAFMYHAPKQGKEFRQIIDEWLEKNANTFDQLKEKLTTIEATHSFSDEEKPESNDFLSAMNTEAFIKAYPSHEQFFIRKVLEINPVFEHIGQGIEKLLEVSSKLLQREENHDIFESFMQKAKQEKIKFIRYRLKEKGLSVCEFFEGWLEEEENDTVLTHICLIMSMKLYDKSMAYARYRLLWDRQYWEVWRN